MPKLTALFFISTTINNLLSLLLRINCRAKETGRAIRHLRKQHEYIVKILILNAFNFKSADWHTDCKVSNAGYKTAFLIILRT